MRSSNALSRRQLLGAISTIGGASLLAGTGTLATFSDTEQSTDNRFQAGRLDLTVEWQERYFDHHAGTGLPIGPESIGLPDPLRPLFAVDEAALEDVLAEAALEAFPDADNDGQRDPTAEQDPCVGGGNLPAALESDRRTANADTRSPDGDPKPILHLTDVKPGDSGVLTIHLGLCDNPGYVRLRGSLSRNAENGRTDPEIAAGDTSPEGDLADYVETLWWYDETGNGVYDPPASPSGPVDLAVVLDTSGSMAGSRLSLARSAATSLLKGLDASARVAVVDSASSARVVQGLTPIDTAANRNAVTSALTSPSAAGGSNPRSGLERAGDLLTGASSTAASGGARPEASTAVVLVSDGYFAADPTPVANALAASGVTLYSVGVGEDVQTEALQRVASAPTGRHTVVSSSQDAPATFAELGRVIGGDRCLLRASLADALAILNQGDGIPLDGDRRTDYHEITGLDARCRPVDSPAPNDGSLDGREPFRPADPTTIGMAWWIPRSLSDGDLNTIQGDSLGLSLEFTVEQARHNGGRST